MDFLSTVNKRRVQRICDTALSITPRTFKPNLSNHIHVRSEEIVASKYTHIGHEHAVYGTICRGRCGIDNVRI